MLNNSSCLEHTIIVLVFFAFARVMITYTYSYKTDITDQAGQQHPKQLFLHLALFSQQQATQTTTQTQTQTQLKPIPSIYPS